MEVGAGRRGHHWNKWKEGTFWWDRTKKSPWGQLGTGLREVVGSLSLEFFKNQLDKALYNVV